MDDNPAVLGNVNGILGAINMGNAVGGTELARRLLRSGDAYGLRAGEQHRPHRRRSVVAPPAKFSDIRYVSGVAGRPFQEVLGPGDCCAADSPRAQAMAPPPAAPAAPAAGPPPAAPPAGGGGAGAAGGLTVDGLPLLKPPYGAISRGESRSRRDRLAGAARRHARQRAQSSGAEGTDHSEDRPGRHRRRRSDGDEDDRRDGRSAGDDDAGASARGDAARLRQGHRQGSRRAVDGGAAERIADDLHARRQAVHRRRDQRRQLLGEHVAFRLPGEDRSLWRLRSIVLGLRRSFWRLRRSFWETSIVRRTNARSNAERSPSAARTIVVSPQNDHRDDPRTALFYCPTRASPACAHSSTTVR